MPKGPVEPAHSELNSKCIPPSVNTFCGKIPNPHNPCICHNASAKRRRILNEMKKIVARMTNMPKCDEWDTKKTTDDTKGPYRFGVYNQNGKPWDPHRVRSMDLVGGDIYRGCSCIKRNGLQDECMRIQCRGRPWCLKEPFPSCPPFSNIPQEICDPDPYKACPSRPWEQHPNYVPPCSAEKVLRETATCSVECPRTGEVQSFKVSPASTADLPKECQTQIGPFYKAERICDN